MQQRQLAIIGLGTMGANLARNAARNGAKVAVYNRTADRTDEFVARYGAEGDFIACKTLEELCSALTPPRPVLMMVKAGKAVDAVIGGITPLLDEGDIIVDGGNSHYEDTERRTEELRANGIRFIGMGVSGGEEGALNGPSMMPGGNEMGYREIEPLLLKMSASVGGFVDNKLQTDIAHEKCVAFIGPGGAGHFVKMVHNGIEYGIMQLIAEAYDLLRCVAGKSNEELADIFASWNEGEDLNSFLMEITAQIFKKKEGSKFVLDIIKDAAGQKGTGKWTTEAALRYGVAIPTINAAVDARILSGSEELRMNGRKLPESIEQPYPKPEKLVSRVRTALELSSICAYAQGFKLIEHASKEKGWNINLGEVARIWRGGCIIRSAFLTSIQDAYLQSADYKLQNNRFEGERQLDWRRAIAIGTGRGIPLPAMAASLAWFDSIRRERLPQNLTQAQRDFFGAHTYERGDKEGSFHTEWRGVA